MSFRPYQKLHQFLKYIADKMITEKSIGNIYNKLFFKIIIMQNIYFLIILNLNILFINATTLLFLYPQFNFIERTVFLLVQSKLQLNYRHFWVLVRNHQNNKQLIYLSQKDLFIISRMGANAAGSLNTAGFSESIKQNRLPSYHHITHSGTYNEQFFEVGHKAKQLLELHHCVGVSNCDLYSLSKRNFFLGLFLKSIKDGMPRTRNINACIVLDISGSMNSPLNYQDKDNHKTRLMLAREAIFMFFQKLKENDIFSLVVFHNLARTVIESEYVSKLNKQSVREAIFQNFESGGTTIRNGFNEAIKNINKYKSDLTNYENRIVMLTDVCDNSVENQHKLINDISQNNSIGTTVIGVSSDFKSETCQKLKQVKNFNYFCAVQNSDLKTYLADRFDFTFFPCVQDIVIKLISDKISSIKVYGTSDEQKTYKKEGNEFTVTKMASIFPSQIIQNKVKIEEIESLGGLILVNFTPNNPEALPEIDLKILLQYKDLDGKIYNKQYVIQQKVSAEEYYSDSAIKSGVSLFYYAESMRNLLKIIGDQYNDANKNHYLENLAKLEDYCPEKKKEELAKVIQIVKAK